MSRAFDAAATSYDSDFTDLALARSLRDRVLQYGDRHFAAGGCLLELGCGTGEDALHFATRGFSVTALDASGAMLARSREKIERAGLESRVDLHEADLADLRPGTWSEARFDSVFSNFGVLNCLPDLGPLGAVLAGALRPGGRMVLVLMARFCPAEMLALLLAGRPRAAFRRWRPPGSEASVGGGSRIRVWYPSPRKVARELGPAFRCVRTLGLGTLLPPPNLARGLERSPRVLDVLTSLDRRLATWPLAARISDHYLIDLERVS